MKKTKKTIKSMKSVVAVMTMTAIMPVNSPNPDDDAMALVDKVKSTNRVTVSGAPGVASAAFDGVAVVVVGSRHVHRASLHVFCAVILLHGTFPLGGSLHTEIFNAHPASMHVASSEISEQNTLAPLHTAAASFTKSVTTTANSAFIVVHAFFSLLDLSITCLATRFFVF